MKTCENCVHEPNWKTNPGQTWQEGECEWTGWPLTKRRGGIFSGTSKLIVCPDHMPKREGGK